MPVLTVDDSLGSAGVAAVVLASHSKVQTRKGTTLLCEVDEKVVLSEPLAIARFLAREAERADLLGTSSVQCAQVEELLAVFQAIVVGEVDDSVLTRINETLQASTFLAGNTITIADVMLFHALRPAVIKMVKGDSYDKFCHLVRWFDYVQHLDCVAVVPVPIRSFGLFDILGANVALENQTSAKDEREQKAKTKNHTSTTTSEAETKGEKIAQTKKTDEATRKQSGSADKGVKKQEEKKPGEKDETPTESKGGKVKEVPAAQVLIGRLDVRVGLIKTVSKHPSADTMYVTEIDIGTSTIPVVTGVAAYFTPEQLVNKKVCVIVNLGASPCKGVESLGRMLCATSQDGKSKEILEAPAASKVGESLTYPGVVNTFDAPISSKNFSKLAKELTTNTNRQVVYRQDFPFTSSAGIITVPTIADGTVA